MVAVVWSGGLWGDAGPACCAPTMRDILLRPCDRAGAIRLEDVVGRSWSKDWGFTRRVKSLREVVGKDEARKWVREVFASRPRRGLGADVLLQALLQDERLLELDDMSPEVMDALLVRFRRTDSVPELAKHFRLHGKLCEATDEVVYEQCQGQHIIPQNRQDKTPQLSRSVGPELASWTGQPARDTLASPARRIGATLGSDPERRRRAGVGEAGPGERCSHALPLGV